VSGFGNSTVWLIFGAFMFAAGYDKTQFGRRLALILVKYLGRRSLTLGYAITFADLLLAPFTRPTPRAAAGPSTRLSPTCRRCTVQNRTIPARVKSVPT
jgi:L-tartrate/succinate antiporter